MQRREKGRYGEFIFFNVIVSFDPLIDAPFWELTLREKTDGTCYTVTLRPAEGNLHNFNTLRLNSGNTVLIENQVTKKI